MRGSQHQKSQHQSASPVTLARRYSSECHMCTKACDLGLRAVAQPRRATAARTLKHCTQKSMAQASQPPSQPARPPARRLPARQAAPPSSQPGGMSRSCSCQAREPKAAQRHSQFATRTYGFCQNGFPKNGSKNCAVFRQENVAVFWQYVTKHDACHVSSHVARKRQRFVAEKRQRFCCRFSASIFSKISKAVFGFANMVAVRCRFSARPVQGSLRLRSSSHPRRSPSAPTVRR